MSSIRVVVTTFTILAALCFPAWAEEGSLRDRLNVAREKLAELGTDPMADAAALEIERARIDIDEASERITNHLDELAEVSVIRLENRVKFIEALIEEATVDALADERESAAIAMTAEAEDAAVAFQRSDAELNTLRDQVTPILNQLEVNQ